MPRRLIPEEECLRLYHAVTRFLTAVRKEDAVLPIIDGLHWADRDSLRRLRCTATAPAIGTRRPAPARKEESP